MLTTAIAPVRTYAGRVGKFFLYRRMPISGATPVMMMTLVEAMPPMRAFTTPSTTRVASRVWPAGMPSLSIGYSLVRLMAVACRKAALTSTSMMMVKSTMSRNPGLPRVRRAISAMLRPFSRRLTDRAA